LNDEVSMHTTQDIIAEVSDLPVQDRVDVVDALLRTLNGNRPEIDRLWGELALHRHTELQSGSVVPVPVAQVLSKVRQHLKK
jgi:hypothetical protein